MRVFRRWMVPILAAILVTASAVPAQAQRTEVGASIANMNIFFGDDTAVVVGVPTGAIGLLSPGAFASFQMGRRAAIGPQLGLVVVFTDDETDYLMNLAVQFDYFLRDSDRSAPFVFGTAGFVTASGSDETPGTFGGGLGYRWRLGDRLVLRVDGRYVRYVSSDQGTNLASFTLSIGGLFGG